MWLVATVATKKPQMHRHMRLFFWEAIELLQLLSGLVGGVGAIRNHVLGYVLNAFDLVLEGSL